MRKAIMAACLPGLLLLAGCLGRHVKPVDAVPEKIARAGAVDTVPEKAARIEAVYTAPGLSAGDEVRAAASRKAAKAKPAAKKWDRAKEAEAIGTLSATRSAQGMYQAKYNTYGSFGDLFDVMFLQEDTFNVGAGTAHKYDYTFTVTVKGNSEWNCVGVPDDWDARYIKIDQTGAIYTSEDDGTTWTPLGE